VVFGQIYGMADQISVPLAAAGLLQSNFCIKENFETHGWPAKFALL
jgi:hypothetical protein